MKSGVIKSNPKTIEYRSFKCYRKNAFINNISEVSWSVLDGFEDINEAVFAWTKLFNDVPQFKSGGCKATVLLG